jgi:hypothetical protein
VAPAIPHAPALHRFIYIGCPGIVHIEVWTANGLLVPTPVICGWARRCPSLERLRVTELSKEFDEFAKVDRSFVYATFVSANYPATLTSVELHLIHGDAPIEAVLQLMPFIEQITHLKIRTEGWALRPYFFATSMALRFASSLTHLDVGDAEEGSFRTTGIIFPNLMYLRCGGSAWCNRYPKLTTLVLRSPSTIADMRAALEWEWMPLLQRMVFFEIDTSNVSPRLPLSVITQLEDSDLPSVCKKRGIELIVVGGQAKLHIPKSQEYDVPALTHPRSAMVLELGNDDYTRIV